MNDIVNRRICFAQRPSGQPTADVFAIAVNEVALPSDGQILCRNLLVSVDPYLRLKMHDRESYTPPLEIGKQIPGGTIAQVVSSRHDDWKAGDLVAIPGGWQNYAVVPGKSATRVDTERAPLEAWLGPLGMTGYTAYAGLLSMGHPKAGETIIVSAAAGAVGSLAGQIGKALGCRVVGIAGSDTKCKTVVETFGFDACIDYRSSTFEDDLRAASPDGYDIYFDNVGGQISFSVQKQMKLFGRIIVCGLISQYSGQNDLDPKSLDEYMRWILVRRLAIRGFIVSDLARNHPEFHETVAGWLKNGQVRLETTLYYGFDQIIPAFLAMLEGRNTGKSIIRIAEAA
jgi:NADPH-dependent curcumin reductase CurA